MRFFASVAALTVVLPGAALAVPHGLPILQTAPSTISIVNEFFFNLPSPFYTISLNSTIASAQGAPDLVGETISLTYFSGGVGASVPYSFRIRGTELMAGPVSETSFLIGPAYTEITPNTFVYDDPFSGFGPRTAPFPEIELSFAVNGPLPTKTAYLYCTPPANTDCELSEMPGLTSIDGRPVAVQDTFVYPEGQIADGTVTFWTVDGRPAVIPLPATLPLLAAALGGLVALRRIAGSAAA